MRSFRFKQFEVRDEYSAMKVGVDSVLLGAWIRPGKYANILDIGCGSGLLMLMMAQRFSRANITGVEIDSGSVKDALHNCSGSPWRDRLHIINRDFRTFRTEDKYDLILTNPPFFKSSLLPPEKSRAEARHEESLNLEVILPKVKSLLADNGIFALVFPYDREEELLELAGEQELYPLRILHTRNKAGAGIKRSFIEFVKKEQAQIQLETLLIRTQNNEYSAEYKELTKEFYLKF